MTPDQNDSAQNRPSQKVLTNPSSRISIMIRLLLPVLVLSGGAIIAMALLKTGPKAKRSPPVRQALLVKTETIRFSDQEVVIQAMGTVQAAREINFHSRVNGAVIKTSDQLLPGGLFQRGEVILQIDPTDYALIIRQRASDLALAKSQLELELGQQTIAKREYEILGEIITNEDQALILRKPQLESARAAVESAQAAMEKARLDLGRTTLRSPFNAIVKSREVDLGTLVSSTTQLATLVGTDEYWIEVSIPVDELKWIRIPSSRIKKGSGVRVFNKSAWGEGIYRTGHVIRLASDLEEQGRMAKLLVSIPDPLELKQDNPVTPLLLTSFVRVEIAGKKMESAVSIDRTLLRDGKYLWIIDVENKLDIRAVDIAFHDRDRALITGGVREGERLITTHLSAPVQGMPLRTDSKNLPSTKKERRQASGETMEKEKRR